MKRRALASLQCAQVGEHATGERRLDPKHLQGSEHRIAAERRAEPGYASIRIGTGVEFGHKQREIGCGSLQPGLKGCVRGEDGLEFADGSPRRALASFQRAEKVFPVGPDSVALARNRHDQVLGLAGRKLNWDHDALSLDVDRHRESDCGLADLAIETPIRKDERIPLRAWPQQFAASDAGNASDLEHVAKVRIDLDLQVSGHVLMREVLHLEGFIELATPKQPAPMNGNLRWSDQLASAVVKRWIGEVRAEYDIVAANSAAKKLRKAAADTQGEAREDAGVILEQAVGSRARADVMHQAMEISACIKHGEQIIVLEDVEGLAVDQRGLCELDRLCCYVLAHEAGLSSEVRSCKDHLTRDLLTKRRPEGHRTKRPAQGDRSLQHADS